MKQYNAELLRLHEEPSPMLNNQSDVIKLTLELFRDQGGSLYGGERVTQLEHALQAAYMARRAKSKLTLVVAALLHDVGHLLHDLPEDAPEHGIEDRHEELAAEWLAARFHPDVVEPARLHVAAKRYLYAVEPEYRERLSPPSLLSLKLQGGPMSAAEVEQFRALPHFADAVLLRRWDEAAKIPGLAVPPIEDYLEDLEHALIFPR